MKNIFSVVTVVVSMATSAQIKIPAVVREAFSKQFPGATNIKWGRETVKEYEANFKLSDVIMSANYDLKGNCKETEMQIPLRDLPREVVKSIQKKYPDAGIIAADKIDRTGGKIIYEITIKISGHNKEVELYTNGKLVK